MNRLYSAGQKKAFNLEQNYDCILIWPLILWKIFSWEIIQNWSLERKGIFLIVQNEKSGLGHLEENMP